MHVPFEDIRSLVQGSSHFAKVLSDATQENILDTLAPYELDSPQYFFKQLGARNSLIGGMAALRALHRTLPRPTRLEIYVDGSTLPRLDEYYDDWTMTNRVGSKHEICLTLGYRYYGQSVNAISIFTKPGSLFKIFFIECTQPPVAVITEAPSTLLMNFIAADGVHSLYPYQTSRRVGVITVTRPPSLHPPPASRLYIAAIEELDALGFKHVDGGTAAIGSHLCESTPWCPSTVRRFPSPVSLHMDLSPELVHSRDQAHLSPIVWRLRSASSCDGSGDGHDGFHCATWGGTIQEGECPLTQWSRFQDCKLTCDLFFVSKVSNCGGDFSEYPLHM